MELEIENKVVVTLEQAIAIELIRHGSDSMSDAISMIIDKVRKNLKFYTESFVCLNDMGVSDLIRALTMGYDIQEDLQ